jgi:hypothetical protein
MALFFMEQMKGLDSGLWQQTFEKFITHPLVQDMILEYLKDLDSIKCNFEILNNFRFGLTTQICWDLAKLSLWLLKT